jgi:hypothetical protein
LGFETELRNLTERSKCCRIWGSHSGCYEYNYCVSVHHPLQFFYTQRFGDWIQSPSSGKTYSVGPNRRSKSLFPYICTNTR